MNVSRPRLALVPPAPDAPEAPTASHASRFDEIFAGHLPSLHRTARVLTRSDAAAEDLVQETAVKAWRAWGDLRAGAAVKAWLHRILHRTFLNTWRAAGRRPRIADVDLDDLLRNEGLADEPILEAPNEDLGDEISEALQALPDGFREAVWLVDVEGLTLAEAAEALEIPAGTVASRVFRAHRLLRERLRAPHAEGRR
jgi:RNA polymerase sigma-70 factor (ECF subfamily)